MAVTISYNKGSGKFYNVSIGSIPISFSSLRTNFAERGSGSISASDLRRDTTDTRDAIVPDATENSNISSSTNWQVSQFYGGKLKYYDITQSGTNDNSSDTSKHGIDISAQDWNSNLGKNIRKVFYIDGTIGSVTVSKYAAYYSSTTRSLSIELRSGGQILGAGGARNSGQGGNAMYVSGGAPGAGDVGRVKIKLNDNTAIKAGGGGGARGGDGWTGPNGPCWIERSYGGGGTGYCEGCRDCPCPNSQITINGVTYNSQNCRNISGCPGIRGCSCAFGWYNGTFCTKTKLGDRQCSIEDPNERPGGPGGIGGNGGLGQGYTQSKSNAIPTLNVTNGPTSRTAANCPTYATSGEDGKTGGNGGDWAQTGGSTTRTDIQSLINAFYVSPSSGYNGSAGGNPGAAIGGNDYDVEGRIDLIQGAR